MVTNIGSIVGSGCWMLKWLQSTHCN